MRTKRRFSAPAPEIRGMRLEVGQTAGPGDVKAKAEATGGVPDLAFLRPPRSTRFADGSVVTLQHWLDLNA
jgi:hypothetical protein